MQLRSKLFDILIKLFTQAVRRFNRHLAQPVRMAQFVYQLAMALTP